MEEFNATKPDARILILQIILSVIIVSTLHSIYTLWILFAVLAIVLLCFCGWKSFFKKTSSFLLLHALLYGLTTFHIWILSDLFPPFLMMLIRVYPTWLTLCILTARLQMDEMLYILDQMHLPKTFSIPVMVVYRYVPTLMHELHYINESLTMRRLNSLHHPFKTLNRHIIPLLSRSEKISEELSASSLCKGLSVGRKRTSCTNVDISGMDTLYLAGMLIVCAALVLFDLSVRGEFIL